MTANTKADKKAAWPRSLFQRNMLLIAVLIVLAQVSSALLFRELVMKPRVRQSAHSAAQHIDALRAGLQALPADQRQRFVERMNAQAQAARAASKDLAPPAFTPHKLRPLEQAYIDQVVQTLSGQGARVAWRREPGRGLSVQISLDGVDYWMAVPGLVSSFGVPRTWLIGSVTTGLLALWGAWLIQRRLNRPLERLTDAARALGRGEPAPVLPEDGPSEIATVARGFNDMTLDLARHEQERALMLAGLSHDLRTPLTKIRLATEMLKGQGDAALLGSVERGIDGMEHLLKQFMDFTRAGHGGAGELHEPLATVDINGLVREVVAMCLLDAGAPADGSSGRMGLASAGGAQSGTRMPDVRLTLADGIPLRPLPVQALRRVLLNLLVNAQRHGHPPIEVATLVPSDRLWIEVRDRGPGIPADQLERVRRPFEQGNAARSAQNAGAGLGLAIVDRIARQYGARLVLLPREGGGLVARLDWPVGA